MSDWHMSARVFSISSTTARRLVSDSFFAGSSVSSSDSMWSCSRFTFSVRRSTRLRTSSSL